jgi:hypothetical protein
MLNHGTDGGQRLLKKPLAKVKKNEIYANMRNELGFHFELSQAFEKELRSEMMKKTNTLAPKEFQRAFGK